MFVCHDEERCRSHRMSDVVKTFLPGNLQSRVQQGRKVELSHLVKATTTSKVIFVFK